MSGITTSIEDHDSAVHVLEHTVTDINEKLGDEIEFHGSIACNDKVATAFIDLIRHVFLHVTSSVILVRVYDFVRHFGHRQLQ
jgi:hypothetical protein